MKTTLNSILSLTLCLSFATPVLATEVQAPATSAQMAEMLKSYLKNERDLLAVDQVKLDALESALSEATLKQGTYVFNLGSSLAAYFAAIPTFLAGSYSMGKYLLKGDHADARGGIKYMVVAGGLIFVGYLSEPSRHGVQKVSLTPELMAQLQTDINEAKKRVEDRQAALDEMDQLARNPEPKKEEAVKADSSSLIPNTAR